MGSIVTAVVGQVHVHVMDALEVEGGGVGVGFASNANICDTVCVCGVCVVCVWGDCDKTHYSHTL